MNEILAIILFFIFSVFAAIKCISYGIYEIKTEKNKAAGITVIVLSVFSVIFSNISVWLN